MVNKKRKRKNVACERLNDEEHEELVRLLREVDWDQVTNTYRRNVIRDDAPTTKGGKRFCRSFIMGPNMKDPLKRPSYWTESNPELFEKLSLLMKRIDPSHQFTNITINKNLRCKAHRDKGNCGMSYIVALGDFTGGELAVGKRRALESANPEDEPYDKLDLHRNMVPFFGAEQTHWTLDFTGERYTCVFYNFPESHMHTVERQLVVPKENSRFASKLENYKKKLQAGKRK